MQPAKTALPVFDAALMQNEFNIVLIRKSPCGGAPYYHPVHPNHVPMEWARACQWLREITEGLGGRVAWSKDNYVSIYIEPAALDGKGRYDLHCEMMELLGEETAREAAVERLRIGHYQRSSEAGKVAFRLHELHRDLAGQGEGERQTVAAAGALRGLGSFEGSGSALQDVAAF